MTLYEAAVEEVAGAQADADAAFAALQASTPGTPAYDAARLDAYYADLWLGWTLFEQEQLAPESEAARC